MASKLDFSYGARSNLGIGSKRGATLLRWRGGVEVLYYRLLQCGDFAALGGNVSGPINKCLLYGYGCVCVICMLFLKKMCYCSSPHAAEGNRDTVTYTIVSHAAVM